MDGIESSQRRCGTVQIQVLLFEIQNLVSSSDQRKLKGFVIGCRDGLSTRSGAGSEEIQLRIDPMHSDLDDEITGLHGQVRQLKNVIPLLFEESMVLNLFDHHNVVFLKLLQRTRYLLVAYMFAEW